VVRTALMQLSKKTDRNEDHKRSLFVQVLEEWSAM
jgi:hypothetical protein